MEDPNKTWEIRAPHPVQSVLVCGQSPKKQVSIELAGLRDLLQILPVSCF